jgi:CheY-like chemotaxis protein
MEKGKRILVVDDDPTMVQSMKLILESRGYATAEAYDAEEAMEKVKETKPDLILLDVMMPDGIEGFHFVWELRQLAPPLGSIPVIVVTAIHDKGELRYYPEQSDGTYEPGEYLPVQDFIDKPIQPAELLARVARQIKPGAGSS